ncbi:MAG TPA: hypothetical protein VIN40_07130 [Candidatus Tyrphobacter sp.]
MAHIARLRRSASTISLEPLNDREVRRLLRLAAGSIGTRLSTAEIEEIAERAEGAHSLPRSC